MKVNLILVVLFSIVACTSETQKRSLKADIYSDELQVIKDSLRSWTQNNKPVSAEVLLIKNGKTIMHEAFGWKDYVKKIPLEKGATFRIASMTKPITATGILKLHEAGKLSVEDPISKYLPQFKTIAGDSITIEHLLRHTSGYGQYQIWRDYGEELRIKSGLTDVVNEIAMHEPMNSVGTEEYTSLNTILLCAIINKVADMPAEDYLHATILKPLEMNNTYLLDTPRQEWLAQVPVTYGYNPDKPEVYWTPGSDPSMYPFFRGATGAATTAKDYAKFLQMWMNGGVYKGVRILEEKTVEMALENKGKGFGLHWAVPVGPSEKKMPGVFGHTGWYGTFAAALPKDSSVVLYFTQTYNAPQIREFTSLVAKSEVFEHAGPYDLNMILPDNLQQPKAEELAQYEGDYSAQTPDGINWSANVKFQNDYLRAQISSEVDRWQDELVYLDNNKFAPGQFNNSSKVVGILPEVYYQFSDTGFKIILRDKIEFDFKKEKLMPIKEGS